jgi:hypothetical protein
LLQDSKNVRTPPIPQCAICIVIAWPFSLISPIVKTIIKWMESVVSMVRSKRKSIKSNQNRREAESRWNIKWPLFSFTLLIRPDEMHRRWKARIFSYEEQLPQSLISEIEIRMRRIGNPSKGIRIMRRFNRLTNQNQGLIFQSSPNEMYWSKSVVGILWIV